MILRVVKMHFQEDLTQEFLRFFETIKDQIEAMPGMVNLRLYQDKNNPNLVFTFSSWLNEEHLNNYRNSELFGSVWPKTKAMFAHKAEAWSLELK